MLLLIGILRRAGDERGFTMVFAMFAMMIALTVTGTAYMAVAGDSRSTAYNQDEKNAYAAAQAGLSWYQIQLTKDPSYWTQCAGVPTVSGHAAPVWDGLKTSTRNWGDVNSPTALYTGISPAIPNGTLAYNVEILPANGNNACVANQDSSVIDNTYGVFRVRVTGRSGGATRALVATFRRKGFLDYLYYTQYETLDPSLAEDAAGVVPNGVFQTRISSTNLQTFDQWEAATCMGRQYAARQGQVYSGEFKATAGPGTFTAFNPAPPCTDVMFSRDPNTGIGDQVNGPLHTVDPMLVCGNPTFGTTSSDKIEVEVNPPTRNAVSEGLWGCNNTWGSSPQYTGTLVSPASPITPPSPNGALASSASAGYLFQGKTSITLNSNGTMDVVNAARYPGGKNMPQPASGVVYAQTNGTCSGYDPERVDAGGPTCGDIRVKGNATTSVTFGADNDIVVTGDLKPDATAPNALIGLIAESGYVRVWHPITTTTVDPTYGTMSGTQAFTLSGAGAAQRNYCNNANALPVMNTVTIQAAILALTHSFVVDNWRCGLRMTGNLNVTGAIAQLYRGPVGCNTCKPGTNPLGATGYPKNYVYDTRLKYRSPPAFLAPVQSAWRTVRVQEQAGAAKITGR